MKKRIIILTMSDKHTGYCVAGIDCETGKWIRLLSDDRQTEGAVPNKWLYYQDGSRIQIYDVIECELLCPVPTNVQPENWLYDARVKWEKVGTSNKAEVWALHGSDNPEYVFVNTERRLEADTIFRGEPSLITVSGDAGMLCSKKFSGKNISTIEFCI
ncbi:MAG: hypothetical protein RR593_02900 [Hungatella sp.]